MQKARSSSRVFLGAALAALLTAGSAVAAPLVIYTRWVGDTALDPRNPDGSFFSYCDFGTQNNPAAYNCIPNFKFGSDFFDDTSSLPDAVAGIGAVDLNADGKMDFLAVNRSGTSLFARSGEITRVPGRGSTDVWVPPTSFPDASASLGSPGGEAVGFTVAPADADATPELLLARSSTGADLIVDVRSLNGTLRGSVTLTVPGMATVSRAAGANFLGFTADDVDGDGIAELMVLHTAPAGSNHALVDIFSISGAPIRTVTLNIDPVASAVATSTFAETYVGGFVHAPIVDGGPREFVVLTVDHSLNLNARAFPPMEFNLWRFDDTGLLLSSNTNMQSVPFYTGAVVVGMTGMTGNDNNCNGIDEDHDGKADDGYVPKVTTCGVGACANTTTSACINGVEHLAPCVPGTPSDEQPDGQDNDCNGQTDDMAELPACGAGDTSWWCCPQGTLHIPVNTLTDTLPDDQAVSGCFPTESGQSGACNLRGAVRRAVELRARPGVRPLCAVVAQLAPGTHQLERDNASFLVMSGADLTLQGMGAAPADVVIKGHQEANLTRRGLVAVNASAGSAALTTKNLTMRDGVTGGSGGAILATGSTAAVVGQPRSTKLTIDQTIFDQNNSNQPGGAVAAADAVVVVRDSLFRNNHVDNFDITGGLTSRGGGLYVANCDTQIERSAFVGNAASKGGGIAAYTSDPLHDGRISIKNSTIARNFCGQFGCGLDVHDIGLTLAFNTISGNQMVTDAPSTARFGPGFNGTWDTGDTSRVSIFGNVIAGNTADTTLGFRADDGQSRDCHVELDPGSTVLGASNNLIGGGGLDCGLLGAPANDPLIGEAVAFNGVPNPNDPVIAPLLVDLPETKLDCKLFAGFTCQLVCPNAEGAADCLLPAQLASPAVGKGTAATCPTDDQRQYTRTPGQACTLGAFEYYGMPGAAAQSALAVLPRGGWMPTSSVSASGEPPANATDGNPSSRFSTGAAQTQGQWFSMDMQTRRAFSQITMDPGVAWPNDYPRQYQVFVSDDAVTWAGPVASGTGAPGVTTVAFPTQTARFVGVVQTGSSSSWWSINEFNVYGPGAAPLAPLPTTGWVATASATGGSDTPSRALDGSLSTRWSSGVAQASGQSFQLDMLQPRTVAKLVMNSDGSTSDYARGYQVFATNDTSNWGAPIASGTGTSAVVTATFPQTTARYLKIVQTGSASSWWSIAELTVYGLGSFAPTATALPRLGWTATASPTCTSEPPARALDDDPTTRFSTCANQVNGQFFQLDMQTQRSFSKVTLDAASSTGDYPRGYAVYATNDPASWGAPIATGSGTGPLVSITFPNQNARYLKIVQTGSVAKWWSIHEINVYGAAPAVLPHRGWSATASLGTSTASLGIDANVSTRWTTGVPQASGQYYQVDLGGAQVFNQITLSSDGAASDYPRAYQIFASNNPSSFGAAIASGVASSPLVSIGLPVQNARYLRVVQTGSSSSWWSLSELNVWAPAP